MIEVKNLYLKYIREYYALYNINLEINDGERVAFLGRDGSGRTTLLRVIAGLEKFDSGEVFINNRDIKKIDFSTDANLGYVPEIPVFFDNKTVYENLKYVLTQRKLSNFEIESRINNALINFKIEKYKNIKVKDLDLYEKYLISFIRLSLRDVDILLIDNIFKNLSEEESLCFVNLINDLFAKTNATIIMAVDNYDLVKDICPKTITFVSGSIEEPISQN